MAEASNIACKNGDASMALELRHFPMPQEQTSLNHSHHVQVDIPKEIVQNAHVNSQPPDARRGCCSEHTMPLYYTALVAAVIILVQILKLCDVL